MCENDMYSTQGMVRRRALAAFDGGEYESARELFEWCVNNDERDHAAWHALGVIADLQGKSDIARACIERALACTEEPDPQYLYNYGTLALRRKRMTEAEKALRKALELKPDYVGALNNLGALLSTLGKLGEAEELLGKVISLDNRHFEAHNNLGNVLKDGGRICEALVSYQNAIRVKPDYAVAGSNYLMCRCYCHDAKAAEVFEAHKRWERRQRRAAVPKRVSNTISSGRRRLRIGYVSPDFRTHSVAYFFEPILDHHNRGAFEIFCYANVGAPDATTMRMKSKADVWRDISTLSDREAASLITGDHIDLLVDLAGHSGDNRLGIFLFRPAPVAITYLGYPNTTGLSTIDWRLTDAWSDPEGQESVYTERLYRLPGGFLCYRPPSSTPPVGDPPCLKNGYVTFGSFNYLAKVNEHVVEAWANLLHRIPRAKIVIKTKPFN
ncbi:MAG: tetratricopeptide repeat protein, partial [Chitinivibrionales bacterium]|nr:tetratricopeptide repeat protein [Chitinivibrionales bacterium]MBD3357346.1 tetratricopeptide repeat protein [Chitinivibrionales bacterium]